MVPLKAEVMVLLDTIQAAKMGGEKPGPISGRHDGSTILCTDQLAEITYRRLIDYTSQIIQRADVSTAKLPLDEAKTGIRRELGVASNQKVKPDGVVKTSEDSPHQILHHGGVLVLATAVVSMQTGGRFTEAVMAEKIVQHADNCVCPLACVAGLINNEVHLSGDGFAAHPKDGGLPRC